MSTSFILKEMSWLVDYISFYEVELTEEKFSYGVMVKDRLVYEYFGSYCRDNQILIQACIFKDLSRVEVSLHLFLFFCLHHPFLFSSEKFHSNGANTANTIEILWTQKMVVLGAKVKFFKIMI